MRRLLIVLAACSSASQAPPAPVGAAASLEAQRASVDDVIVAQVNGKPVWGSCVATQAVGKSREAALRECVDFELLAQAAHARQLELDPDVVEATRAALVNQVVAKAYEAVFTKPEDFGASWEKIADHDRALFDHPEYRSSTYVRVPIALGAPGDAEAHALADQIAVVAANETGLMSPQFVALASQVAPGHPVVRTSDTKSPAGTIEFGDVPPALPESLNADFARALWAIPEVGRTSPAIRTKWGWDVILWSEVMPAVHPQSPEDLVAKLLPDARRAYFTIWVNKLTRGLGVHVEMFRDNVSRLESE